MEEIITSGTVVEPKDDLDREISCDILTMVSSLDSNSMIFRGDKKKGEDYFGTMLNLTQSLLKANQHYRNYIEIEQKFLTSYKDECIKNPNKNTNLSKKPVNLNAEIDGLFSQIKASLDTLGTSLRYTLDISVHAWHKDGKKSGGKIINTLNGLGTRKTERITELIEYIEGNSQLITYLVSLRDNANHHGGIKSISDIIFDYKTQSIIPQLVKHPDGNSEEVNIFLLNSIRNIKSFCHGVIILSILAKVGEGMTIVKDENQLGPPYRWGITNIKTGE